MDNPSYFEDNYAAKFLTGKSVFPLDTRIFHRADCSYDTISAAGNAVFDGQVLRVDLFFHSGAAAMLKIRAVRPGVLRLQFGRPDAAFDETSPMLAPLSEEAPLLTYIAAEDAYRVELNDYTLIIDRFPFCLHVTAPSGEVIFESEMEKMVDQFTCPPMGFRRPYGAENSAVNSAYLSWRRRNHEHWFGLGEKFNRFEKTGTHSVIWEADTCGSNTTDLSYKAVPVVFSTAGWALFIHTAFRSHWELGSFSYASGGALVEDDRLDLFLILAPSLKDQIITYTAITGRPSMPPRWAFGLWMSRAPYQNRAQMLEVAERLRKESIPCDTFNIDPTWMEGNYYGDVGVEVCNFNWSEAAWGDPLNLFQEFKDLGYSICLWINPYFSTNSPAYQEALRKGYLVKTASGEPAGLEFDLKVGVVDFTNPAAKAWWQAKLIDLLKKGAATFKVDFGDRIPEDAVFFNSRGGLEMHNLYVHLYCEAVYEAVAATNGRGIVWRRPGYVGSQRFPGCWAGDTQVTWEGMAGALRGGLSAAFSGESFWSHDMGGFVGAQPSEELYIRWAQFGLLSPFSRFHGTTPREPWFYGERAVQIVRAYAQLRYSLVPYLLAAGHESTESGLPILRPLVLEFPDEPHIETIDDQYLLGPDLLIAPVFQPGQRCRTLYLPKGSWWPLERTSGSLSGPGYREVDAPLEHLPIFIRAGAVIPRYKTVPQHLKGPTPKEWQLDIYPGDTHRRLVFEESDFTFSIDYRCENGSGRLIISPAPINFSVRLIDRAPTFMRAGGGAALRPGSSGANFTIDASQGVRVEFR